MAAWLAHGVAIHADHGHIREFSPHFLLQPLGSEAAVANAVELAIGTNGRRLRFVLAVVAQQTLSLAMMRERQVTVRAASHKAAGWALHVSGVTAAIE